MRRKTVAEPKKEAAPKAAPSSAIELSQEQLKKYNNLTKDHKSNYTTLVKYWKKMAINPRGKNRKLADKYLSKLKDDMIEEIMKWTRNDDPYEATTDDLLNELDINGLAEKHRKLVPK